MFRDSLHRKLEIGDFVAFGDQETNSYLGYI